MPVDHADALFPLRGRVTRPVLVASVLVLGAVAASPVRPAVAAEPAATAAVGRVELPSPTLYDTTGTPASLDATTPVSLRVYLTGKPAGDIASAALAVSAPGSPGYGQYLTPAQFQGDHGPAAAQVQAVSGWLVGAGLTVTADTAHYLAVSGTVAEADRAFDTQVVQYITTTSVGGNTFTSSVAGVAGSFSVPAALSGDVATVTGIDQTAVPGNVGNGTAQGAQRRRTRPAVASAASSPASQCSQYWGQYTTAIPAAYGLTTAPTQLCGYTAAQMRSAYGITGSTETGKGVTVAIVLAEAWPTMLSDANRFFASQGIAQFQPGQYTENKDSRWTSTCGVLQSEPGIGPDGEEAIDVETVHMAAPRAKVVLVAADCDPSGSGESPLALQDMLDATTRVVDNHLADVVSSSWGSQVDTYSPADIAAWNLVFEQGALEGIGFNYSSGDGGSISPDQGLSSSAQFPAASPWVTAVGGTSLMIGQNGQAATDFPWGDNVAAANADGTGYAEAPPGEFSVGSGGGLTALFAEPGYQQAAVPAALATQDGATPARRVVPDISADAGSLWLIGYTGAVTSGVYGKVADGGGTSGSAPLVSGLEADAIQASGHPLGFANPVLYQLAGTSAIADVGPVSPQHPPVLYGSSVYAEGDDNLTTLGEDGVPLQATPGYDDVTGLGAVTPSFVTTLAGTR